MLHYRPFFTLTSVQGSIFILPLPLESAHMRDHGKQTTSCMFFVADLRDAIHGFHFFLFITIKQGSKKTKCGVNYVECIKSKYTNNKLLPTI